MYTEMLDFVREYLKSKDRESTTVGKTRFRKRSEHTERVYMWAQRLIEGEENIDRQALLTAAIFHDVGYADVTDDYSIHGELGSVICEKYLSEHSFDTDFTKKVAYLIKNHSKKEMMQLPDTSVELIILMEADILDESGALSIVWDCMIEGAADEQSFQKTYGHIGRYTAKQLGENPMFTERGRALWGNKQRLIRDFIDQLGYDLGIEA
jgi:Predicted HD superfamily hydrolase